MDGRGVAKKRKTRPREDAMRAATATKKVIVDFPELLIRRTEKAASELGTDKSKLIRSAVERLLTERDRLAFERELAEGYEANAAMDRRISAEFAHIDAENI